MSHGAPPSSFRSPTPTSADVASAPSSSPSSPSPSLSPSPSPSLLLQQETEKSVLEAFELTSLREGPDWVHSVRLRREKHRNYLLTSLRAKGHIALLASGPWKVYWAMHALELLDCVPQGDTLTSVIEYLSGCQHPDGGFGGGDGQIGHLAPTYAAILTLCIIGTEAFSIVNRQKMYEWLMRIKKSNGSFAMHVGGEADVRSTYCALVIASLLNILTPRLVSQSADYIIRCQTYEGGIGGEPGTEAHGGYAFCGIAALAILDRVAALDLPRFLKWVCMRQGRVEGGFMGRANKLVDGCYSWWQGGVFPLIDMFYTNKDLYQLSTVPGGTDENPAGGWMFDQLALQEYLLGACQSPFGGLLDKPGCPRDLYHTCYTLSGLSVAQHNPFYYSLDAATIVSGHKSNLVELTHPIYNIHPQQVVAAHLHFSALPPPKESQSK